MRLSLIGLLVLSVAGSLAFGAVNGQPDGSVLLPAQTRSAVHLNPERQASLSRSPAWQAFTSEHGHWSVSWNEATGTPHRAFGNAIRLSGFSSINAANVEQAASAFLGEHSALLGVDPGNLRLTRATEVNGRWYVSYRQMKEGIDVLFSEIELRMFSNGNLTAFGADCYPAIDVPVIPSLTYDAAMSLAAQGLESPVLSGNGAMYILPIVRDNGIDFRLVYEVFAETANPPGNYIVLVDAHDGTLHWRHNRVRYTEVSGTVTGMVQLVLPTDPFVEQGFGDEYVTIGGAQVRTDSLGHYVRDITSSTTLTTSLAGPYVNVNRNDGTDATFSAPVDPGDTVDILWGDANSHPAERDGFYHTNIIHDFITTLDPSFTFINYSMPCAVNINDVCNAFWNGFGINFFREGSGCPNTAQMPDVVYHEYGHGINDKLYQQLGQGNGMINGAVHEGMADVAASVIVDDPRVGRGFFGPGTILRNIDNTARYPENVSGDPHITGLILAGAFWDLRETTDLETFRYLSHFAKYGLPDDFDDGTAFSEWFLETLIVDDDDGNLGNGTPHVVEIVQSFNLHGIGSELYYRDSFTHTPLANTTNTTDPYPVSFTLQGVPLSGGEPDSVQVIYSVDNFATSAALPAALTGADQYDADIPAQSWGTLVKYYITAYDPLGELWYNFPEDAPVTTYRFLVGDQPAQPGVMYAASTGTPYGSLYWLNLSNGEATLIGSLGTRELQSLAVRPSTKELYGSYTFGTTTTLFRVSSQFGDALTSVTVPLANIRAIAFGNNDTLYAVNSIGSLYRINIATGAPTLIGTSTGRLYWGLAMNPEQSQLWGSVRFADGIYTINRTNGASTLVGETGFNTTTLSLAFDPFGELYGLTAGNDVIRIDTQTGTGTLIGSPTPSGIIAMTMRTDSLVLSVGNDIPAGVPQVFALDQNYPNPFNPETEIRYALPEQSSVTLRVYTLLGREVALLQSGVQDAGYHVARWNGRDRSGSQLASGVYFYRISAVGKNGHLFNDVKKMMLLK
jgi:Zn-dependent metalloprotease